MDIYQHWPEIKKMFNQGFKSSLHYAIATVSEQGEPRVTPIGSLILTQPGKGFYFEEFTKHLPKNLRVNQQICVLAVNSSKWLWLKSLILGGFTHPPALRLYGKVGQLRPASSREIKQFQRRVNPVRFTKGYSLMWSNMQTVRDIEFTKIEPVLIGQMTQHTWTNRLVAKST